MLSAYAKETSRLCGIGYQLRVALIRSLVKRIPVHSCSGPGGDEYVGPAWLKRTSDYPLALLRSLTIMTKVCSHGAGEGGGWIDNA